MIDNVSGSSGWQKYKMPQIVPLHVRVYVSFLLGVSHKSVTTAQHTADSVTLCCHQVFEPEPGLLESSKFGKT